MRGANIQRLIGLIRRYRLEHYNEVQTWLKRIDMCIMDDRLAGVLIFRCQKYIKLQDKRPNFLEPDPSFEELYEKAPGGPDLILGHLLDRPEVPIGIMLEGAVHCLFSGTPGGGKSVALRRLILAIEEYKQRTGKRISIIVLDRKGRDCVHIPRLLGKHWRHFDLHGELRLGLQNPKGVLPDAWISKIVGAFCARASLQYSRITLANAIRQLVAAMNPNPKDPLMFPDFRLILDVVRRLPKRRFAERETYVQSLMQILEDVVQSTGELFRTFNGLDLERDLISKGESAVISMPLVSPSWISHFIADLFVLQLLAGRMHRGQLSKRPEVFLIIDEADTDVAWDNERQFPTSMPPLCLGARFLREYGVGICLGVGSLVGISRQVLNAATYHFAFKQSDEQAMDAVGAVLMLPPDAEVIIPTLQPGQVLVRVPYWSHALLANILHMPADHAAEPVFDANDHIASKRLDEIPGLLKALHEGGTVRVSGQTDQAGQKPSMSLSPDARALLISASLRPYWPYIRLFDQDALPSSRTRSEIQTELTKQGFARFKNLRVGKRTLTLIQLTDLAWEHLGKSPIKLQGRGEIEHTHMAAWIRMVGEKRGYDESVVEFSVPGTTHPADGCWKVDGKWQAFEVVVTCKENISSHLDSILRRATAPIDSVTIVAAQKSVLQRLQSEIEGSLKFIDQLHRIHYEPAGTFLKELWP